MVISEGRWGLQQARSEACAVHMEPKHCWLPDAKGVRGSPLSAEVRTLDVGSSTCEGTQHQQGGSTMRWRREIPRLITLLAFLLPCLFFAGQAQAQIVAQESFENGWGLWSAENGVWEIGTPTAGPAVAHGGVRCAGTVLSGTYPRYTGSRLLSPAINLPSVTAGQEIVLRFWQWFSYYNEPNTTDDQGQVRIQVYENGAWTENAIPFLISTLYAPVWSPAQADLTAYAGKRVRIVFYHQDYYAYLGSESYGWYIDDVLVERRAVCSFDKQSTEGFEGGWGCWWASNGVWEIGSPAPAAGPGGCHSGTSCAGTVLGGVHPRYTRSSLISPPIDLEACNEIYLRFWQWFSYYNEPNTTDDSGYVQIQTLEEGGWSEWTTLQTVTLNSGGWSQSVQDLTAYAGKRIRIAFYHQDYYAYLGSESYGWYIDDVEITGCPSATFKLDLKVNGSDGLLFVNTNQTVSVTLKIDAGQHRGTAVDWWINRLTPAGAYWYNPSEAWVFSETPVFYSQDPLEDMPLTTVFTGTLPGRGIYDFCAVLEYPPDGIFNPVPAYSANDCVRVLCR
jgi:hypothetical protein